MAIILRHLESYNALAIMGMGTPRNKIELLVSGVINFLRSLRTKWIWSMHNSKCKIIIWIKVKIARDHFLNHWRTQLLNVSKIYLNGIYCWHTGREASFDVNYTEQLFLSNVWRRENRPFKAMDHWGKIHSRESKKSWGEFCRSRSTNSATEAFITRQPQPV